MERTPATFCLLVVLLGMLLAELTCAQAVDDAGQWNAVLAQGKLDELGWENDRLRWWFDGHFRMLDDADGFNQSIVRPGIGWEVNDRSVLWAGYGWIRTSPLTGDDFGSGNNGRGQKSLRIGSSDSDPASNNASSKPATIWDYAGDNSFASRTSYRRCRSSLSSAGTRSSIILTTPTGVPAAVSIKIESLRASDLSPNPTVTGAWRSAT